MDALGDLLPHITRRVADVADAGKAWSLARLDNDLYVSAILMPVPESKEDLLRFSFCLFFNPDGSHARPPINILGDLLALHLGYDVSFPGAIWGDREVRNDLRTFRKTRGWGRVSLAVTRVKASREVPHFAPRCWAVMGVHVQPDRTRGHTRYDWPRLGTRVLETLEPILQVLEAARPKELGSPYRSQ